MVASIYDSLGNTLKKSPSSYFMDGGLFRIIKVYINSLKLFPNISQLSK